MRFTKEQKRLSRSASETSLRRGYENTEKRLTLAANAGDRRALDQAMKAHHRYEYALLHKSYERGKKKR